MYDALYRGEQAKRLLSDPLFVEARETVVGQLRDIIVSLPLSARDDREQAVAILKGAEQFFRIFEMVLNDYEIATAEMLSEAQIKARHAAIEDRLNNG